MKSIYVQNYIIFANSFTVIYTIADDKLTIVNGGSMNKSNHYLIILLSIVVIVGCGKKETFVFKTNEGAVEIRWPGKLKDVKTMKS